MKSHPGDWLWIIARGRFVAMTHDAYDRARRIVDLQSPDVYGELRARELGIGEMFKLALDVLEHDGEVRRELHQPSEREDFRWPVYGLVPAAERAELPVQQRPKRARRKRAAAAEPPSLVLVQGGGSD